MADGRPQLRRPPTRRKAAIRARVEAQGEIGRSELLEWVRSSGLAERSDTGAEKVTTALFRLRREGAIDYDRERVWVGRNPTQAGKLSRKKDPAQKKIESESKRLVGLVFQAVSNWKALVASNDFRHGTLAR